MLFKVFDVLCDGFCFISWLLVLFSFIYFTLWGMRVFFSWLI